MESFGLIASGNHHSNLSIPDFADCIGNAFFSHVRVREFKAVTGKCKTCANLSSYRKKAKDALTRQYVTSLFSYHRSAFMGERQAYATRLVVAIIAVVFNVLQASMPFLIFFRIQHAILQPAVYLSIVSDGMAQGHCNLPWEAGKHGWNKLLPQHLQGVLMHGRHTILYRTFHTVNKGANLQAHCFLLALEKAFVADGKKVIKSIITSLFS